MGYRLVPILLFALLAIVQAQLWFGPGSLPHVSELRMVKANEIFVQIAK